MPFRVDLIVPVYNEEKNFARCYELVRERVRADWRLLVVYDFPEDTTRAVAEPIAAADPRVRLVLNRAGGALNAVKTGIAASEAELIITIMVDDPPEVINRYDDLVCLAEEKKAAVVAASRYMKGGAHTGGPFMKGLLSRLAGVSLHWLIGLPTHDATYNTRLYRKSFLETITIESKKGFEVALELTVKAYLDGWTVAEVPVRWQERTVGASRFRVLAWLAAYLRWYWFAIYRAWITGIAQKTPQM